MRSDRIVPFYGMLTWGTETSQYPQENKTTVIPEVVASEPGTAQTDDVFLHFRGCRTDILS